MLAIALALAMNASPVVVAVPFGVDVPSHALADALLGAVPRAASERGLGSTRTDRVRPVDEAIRRCRDDACTLAEARRLGASLVIVTTVGTDELTLRLLDAD